MASRPWTVLPHDPIQRLAPNLWNVDADLPGMPLRRRLVVVRLPDGRLVLHNAVCLNEAAMQELEAWGEPAFLIVPNGWHRLDAHAWAQRYPKARVLTSAVAAKKVREVVEVHGTYDELPRHDAFRMELLDGSKAGEAVGHVRHDDGGTSLVFNDTLMNNGHGHGGWWWAYRYLARATGGPKVTGLMRLVGVSDKRALRAHLERLADVAGLVRVIPGHGGILEGEAAAAGLRVAAAGL